MNTTSGTSSSTKSSSKYFLPWEVTKHCQDKYYLLGPANCKPGGRTLDTQTASADLSLTSAALSSCIPPLPMQSAYDPYLPGVVSTPNPLCIIAPLVHSQCPIDAESAEHLAASSCSPASPPNRQIPSLAPNIRPHEIWPPPPNAGLFFTHTHQRSIFLCLCLWMQNSCRVYSPSSTPPPPPVHCYSGMKFCPRRSQLKLISSGSAAEAEHTAVQHKASSGFTILGWISQ